MKPFLRPRDRGQLAPVGWTAQPAGVWNGKEVDLVYDPKEHAVVLWNSPVPDPTRAAFAGEGFRRLVVDDTGKEMWVRSRADAMRARLACKDPGVGLRLERSPGLGDLGR